jgi:hypothetical protein
LIPLAYFLVLRLLVVFISQWYWWLILVLLINLFCFFLFSRRLQRKRIWFFLLYSEIFSVIGFVFITLLSNQFFINLFLVFWSIIYLVYLEAIFNYLYRTKKFFLIDLKNITAYINLMILFLLVFSLINLFIFLNLDWWWVISTFFAISFILFFERFLTVGFDLRKNVVYSLAATVILVELMVTLLWWPLSIYVLAVILMVAYYLLSSLSVLSHQNTIGKKLVIQYIVFAVIVLLVVMAQAQWL